jgi:hypothetical protein
MADPGAFQETLLQGNDAALNIRQEKRVEIANSVVTMTDQMTKMATASSYGLRGHIKSGQRWSPENRPTEVAWD